MCPFIDCLQLQSFCVTKQANSDTKKKLIEIMVVVNKVISHWSGQFHLVQLLDIKISRTEMDLTNSEMDPKRVLKISVFFN